MTQNGSDNEKSVIEDRAENAAVRDTIGKGLGGKAIEDEYRYGSKLCEQQRLQAPMLREANATSPYLARLPLEIRQEMYKLVLGSGTVLAVEVSIGGQAPLYIRSIG